MDIFLPELKTPDEALAREMFKTGDYPEVKHRGHLTALNFLYQTLFPFKTDSQLNNCPYPMGFHPSLLVLLYHLILRSLDSLFQSLLLHLTGFGNFK